MTESSATASVMESREDGTINVSVRKSGTMPNSLEQELKAVQTSIAYCKSELKKYEDNEIIKEKVEHYLEGLQKHESFLLKQLNGGE